MSPPDRWSRRRANALGLTTRETSGTPGDHAGVNDVVGLGTTPHRGRNGGEVNVGAPEGDESAHDTDLGLLALEDPTRQRAKG